MFKNFIIKSASLIVIIAGIVYYQRNALAWKASEETNKAEIAEVEEYNKNMAGKEKAALQLYNDGVYSASADGFGGIIKTEVIINNGNIEEVNIVEAENEDKAYLKMAIAVINDIIEKQSADVDTISGATYSSTGILNSVEKALSKAKG